LRTKFGPWLPNTKGSELGADRSALVAVEHSLIITAGKMLTDGAFYRELGADYYTMCKPAKAKAHAVSQLEALGYTVTLKPLAETA
jgi:transposase